MKKKPIECDYALWVECEEMSESLYDIAQTFEEAEKEKAQLERNGLTVKVLAQPKNPREFKELEGIA